jgi:polar amino acid transport system substrate-binding protein
VELTTDVYTIGCRKGSDLTAYINDELAKFYKDGTMQEIDDIWMGIDEEKKVVDMSDLTGENGTIRVVTTSTDMPWSYIKDGKNVGYDIDLIVRFCRDKGYALELGDVDFAGRIPALESGKYDFTTDMNVTPEREEEVLFSDPTCHGGLVLAVLSEKITDHSFISKMISSFDKTFIRENRYTLFWEGILTTIVITIASIVFGTLFGFLIYMLCRKGGKLSNSIADFLVWLIQGMPVVVLLMILYYVVFAKSSIDGAVVSVIAFTLVFGVAVFGMLKMGV